MTRKISGSYKAPDVTLKRGIGAAAEEGAEKKKLLWKTKPPTLKRGKNEPLEAATSGNIRIEGKPKPSQTGQFSSKTAKKPSVKT